MVSSSSENTPSQAGHSPLVLIGLVAIFLCVVTFLPRVVLSASGVAKLRQSNTALVPYDERFATFARVERLMQSGTKQEADEAGRLLDGMETTPLVISECDSVGENGNEASFSSSILIAKLGRQFDDAAARAVPSGGRPTAINETNALQWTQRARRIADALMLSPHPSYTALKTAHYLDAIAGQREAAVLQACGNVAQAAMADKQNTSIKQVWHGEILPVLERTKPTGGVNEPADTNENSPYTLLSAAQWAAQIDYLVSLYQKERVFISQA